MSLSPLFVLSDTPTQEDLQNKPLYFPAPPVISTIHRYQNINADKNLQIQVTEYFYDELLKWINTNEFYSIKSLKKTIESDNGYELTYKLLKLFVKKGDTNWYDLKIQYDLVKKYMLYKLEQLAMN